jgi:hypothetical protein
MGICSQYEPRDEFHHLIKQRSQPSNRGRKGEKMTNEETKTIETINKMSQKDMASLWRYAPSGHPYFDKRKPFFEVFDKRFTELGRFTPEISKSIDH